MFKKDLILKHLKTYGSITKSRAAQTYSVYGLGDVIMQLRDRGHNIETIMISRYRRNSYAKYRFHAPKKGIYKNV